VKQSKIIAKGIRTGMDATVGLYPIFTLQYSSTTLFQVSNHIQ
jgi:hypothetical protein